MNTPHDRIQQLVFDVNEMGVVPVLEVEGHRVFDKVLLDLNAMDARQEAVIVDLAPNSVQIKRRDRLDWYGYKAITDNLGQASDHELKSFTIEPPPVAAPLNVQTGTYILDCEIGTLLVEVDRVEGDYYIRLLGTATNIKLNANHLVKLHQFSDPDAGDYLVDPGIYMVKSVGYTIEVIPHNGANYFRWLDSPELFRLTPEKVVDMARIESDSLDINAVLVVDKSELEDNSGCCGGGESSESGCCAPPLAYSTYSTYPYANPTIRPTASPSP
jgi:hypothetical protein